RRTGRRGPGRRSYGSMPAFSKLTRSHRERPRYALPCWVAPTLPFRSRATTGRTLMIKRRNKRTSAAAPRRRSPSPRSRQTRGSQPEHKPASPLGSPSVVVVMGVSGCGKSTIASMLAHRLNWIFEEGDWFHPPSNVEKMHNRVPLTDEDRWPWLHG